MHSSKSTKFEVLISKARIIGSCCMTFYPNLFNDESFPSFKPPSNWHASRWAPGGGKHETNYHIHVLIRSVTRIPHPIWEESTLDLTWKLSPTHFNDSLPFWNWNSNNQVIIQLYHSMIIDFYFRRSYTSPLTKKQPYFKCETPNNIKPS